MFSTLKLFLAIAAALIGCRLASGEQPPNILFIIADDASRDSMGVYGSTYVKTPNFDRIAREGTLFTNAYNCNPKCAPARACLLTGRYSWQLKEACNHNPFLSDEWVFYPFLFVHNFKPERWPGGNPEYDFMNCDASPTKKFLTELKKEDADYRFFEMSFGKRPEEELFDVLADPDCVRNLASEPEFSEIKTRLSHQLNTELTSQQDPRVLGDGDIFDFYPNCRIDRQQKLYGKPDYDPVKLFEEKYGPRKDSVDK